ncbi:MAG: hypothetical protein JWL59_3859 [Chthoniobacteraceae bacterium]|nr:hypothetical protein [Chthoniobacteraceae bacterium]
MKSQFVTLGAFVVLCFMDAGPVFAQGASRILKIEQSPKRTFSIEHRTNRNARHETWLVSSQSRILLFRPSETEADYDPELVVSPDEAWIARNQKRGSNCILTMLHRREAPLVYSQIINLEQSSWRYAEKGLRLAPGTVPPFHRTLQAVRWLDSSSLLLQLSGDNPNGLRLGTWHCVYHVKTRAFSIPAEFAVSNRRALIR